MLVPHRYFVGVKASTLGIGAEAGVQLTDRSRVRAGFNFFRYDEDFHKNGADGTGRLTLQSVQVQYDWAPISELLLCLSRLAALQRHESAREWQLSWRSGLHDQPDS